MRRPWHQTCWVGLVLMIGGLLASGWTADPAVNFLVGAVPFWVGVIVCARAYLAGRRARRGVET